MFEFSTLFETRKKRKAIPISVQKQLLIRCKGKCENCGKDLTGLKPFIHHKDGNPSNNKLSNLIVLCPDCHYSQDTHVYKTVTEYDIFGFPHKKRKLVTKKFSTRKRNKTKKSVSQKKKRRSKKRSSVEPFGFFL